MFETVSAHAPKAEYYSYSYRQDDSYYGADSYVLSATVSLSQESIICIRKTLDLDWFDSVQSF